MPDHAVRLRPGLVEPEDHACRTSPAVATDALRQMLSNPHHVFWPDDVMFTDGAFVPHGALLGHRQVTDVYLVALALRHGGVLATLDQALPWSLPATHTRAVVVVSP